VVTSRNGCLDGLVAEAAPSQKPGGAGASTALCNHALRTFPFRFEEGQRHLGRLGWHALLTKIEPDRCIALAALCESLSPRLGEAPVVDYAGVLQRCERLLFLGVCHPGPPEALA
jgi:hypothetical protein